MFATIQMLTLANGLGVVLDPQPDAPRVSISMIIDAGSGDDPPGAEGVAHLLEHLWFESRTADGATVWDAVRALGCDVQGTTFDVVTEYDTTCPRDALDQALALEAQRLAAPLAGVTEDDVAYTDAVIVAEHAWRSDPDRLLSATVFGALYPPEHPMAERFSRPTHHVGTRLAAVAAFAAAQYKAPAVTLAISGGFDDEAVRDSLSRRIAAITALQAPTPEARPPSPTRSPPAPQIIEADVEQPLVFVAWPMSDSASTFDRSILARLLGSSIFDLDDPDVTKGHCDVPSTLYGGPIICTAEVPDASRLLEIGERVANAAGWVASDGRRIDTLVGRVVARWMTVGGALAAEDLAPSPDGRAATWASIGHFSGVVGRDRSDLGLLSSAVVSLARDEVDASRAVVIGVRPGHPKTGMAAPELAVRSVSAAATLRHAEPARLDTMTGTLGNGLRVVAVRRADAEVVHAVAHVDAPWWTVGWGTRYAARIGVLAMPDDSGVTFTAHDHDVASAVFGLATEIDYTSMHPWTLPDKMPDVRYTPETWAGLVARALLHPSMATPFALGDRSELDELQRAFTPEATVVVVVGPGSPSSMYDAVRGGLDQWRGQGAYMPPTPEWEVPPTRRILVEDPGSTTAHVVWACPIAADASEASVVAEELLRTTLFTELRRRRGWAYTPVASITRRPGAAWLFVHAEVPTPHGGDAVALIESAIGHLVTGASDDELDAARERVLWDQLPDRLAPGDVAGWVLAQNGPRDPATAAAWAGAVRTVRAADVSATLGGCRESAVVAVAAPAAMAPQLGEGVLVLNADGLKAWLESQGGR